MFGGQPAPSKEKDWSGNIEENLGATQDLGNLPLKTNVPNETPHAPLPFQSHNPPTQRQGYHEPQQMQHQYSDWGGPNTEQAPKPSFQYQKPNFQHQGPHPPEFGSMNQPGNQPFVNDQNHGVNQYGPPMNQEQQPLMVTYIE